MKKIEVKVAINKLKDVFLRLKEACDIAIDDLDKDGVIQRFEFTVELLWKTLKIVLEYNKIDCTSPRDCIKKSYRYSLIEDDEILLDMLEDRNRSSHIYNQKVSEEIFMRIKNYYVEIIEKILNKIEKM